MNIILNNCSTKTFSIKPINYKILKNDERIKVYNRQYYLTKKSDGTYYNDKYLSYYKYTARGWNSFYILGNGGYALAVQAAAKELKMEFTNITRDNWDTLHNIKHSLIYNCTPVEDLKLLYKDNVFIDCIATTTTGHKLATMQAAHQFKLYTKLEFPWKIT